MEEKLEEVEDAKSISSDSFIDDSEGDEPSTSGQEEGLHFEASDLIEYYLFCSSLAVIYQSY